MAFDSITQFQQCISTEEKKGRASVTLVNVVIWLFLIFLTACSFGALLVVVFVGPKLYDHLSESALKTEAGYLYSGFVGWLLRGHLTHPPAGARLENLDRFWASAEGGRV
ncbi:MAG TPA: hypothetical protein VMX74_12900 [Pirellulales bacterium]|nr:hypothetical protein [Pirellulales bacterium]